MQSIFKVVVFVFALSLGMAGCFDQKREYDLQSQIDHLSQKNLEIQKKYDDFFAEVTSENKRIQGKINDAGLAQGCDWLIPLCPYSLVASGRQAIYEGFRPNPVLFWLYALMKFTLIALLLNVSICMFQYLNFRFNMPNKEKLKSAEQSISNAISGMWHEKAVLEVEIDTLILELQDLHYSISQMEERVDSARMHLNALDAEIQESTAVRDALNGI